jgi:hypothetical protein
LDFISDDIGWISDGFGNIGFHWSVVRKTTDGGISWESQDTLDGELYRLMCFDSNFCVSVGALPSWPFGTVARTFNGGSDWTMEVFWERTSPLYDICISSADVVTVVGDRIIRSTDSGSTWSQQSDYGLGLRGVSFIDDYVGWAVGVNGTILHTTNGGVVPVELTSFTAEAMDQRVFLKWTTATELNNNGFEIQRKVAESDFATVGFVRGEGTTTNQREYSYIDKDLADGKYFYRLKQIDYNGTYEYTNVNEVDVRSLNEFALEQNYPNPYNSFTSIGNVLKEKTSAKLILLNAIGEEVASLVNEEQDKGYHKIDFNASTLASGVYFYQLKAGEYKAVKKMILMK